MLFHQLLIELQRSFRLRTSYARCLIHWTKNPIYVVEYKACVWLYARYT